jgi:hypothetical protein
MCVYVYIYIYIKLIDSIMLLGRENGKIKVLLERSIKNNGKKYIFLFLMI